MTPTSHIRALIVVPATLLPMQLLLMQPGKAAEDVSNTWAPDTSTGDPDGVPDPVKALHVLGE